VADGIYMLEGEGGNIGVSAGEDGVFLIDDQYAPLNAQDHGRGEGDLGQADPLSHETALARRPRRGNENLGKAGVVIIAHDNVLQTDVGSAGAITALKQNYAPALKAALPVITFGPDGDLPLERRTTSPRRIFRRRTPTAIRLCASPRRT